MTTPDTNSPRRSQVDKKLADDEIQRISKKTGAPPEVVRIFAWISAPENAHLFTVEAVTKAMAKSMQAIAERRRLQTDELQPLTPEQHAVIAKAEPSARGRVIESFAA